MYSLTVSPCGSRSRAVSGSFLDCDPTRVREEHHAPSLTGDSALRVGLSVDQYAALTGKTKELQKPCDRRGWIASSSDGVFCDGADVCLTALPQDFGEQTGALCQTLWRVGQQSNTCRIHAGQPWCVPPEALAKYHGPVEIWCSASGPGARDVIGHPSGCWWVRKNTNSELQRLAGGLSRKDAVPWIQHGILSRTSADFLSGSAPHLRR